MRVKGEGEDHRKEGNEAEVSVSQLSMGCLEIKRLEMGYCNGFYFFTAITFRCNDDFIISASLLEREL